MIGTVFTRHALDAYNEIRKKIFIVHWLLVPSQYNIIQARFEV